MKALTDREAMDWCRALPLQLEFDDAGRLSVPRESQTYTVDISKMPWRELLPTATSLAFLGSHVPKAFSGGLVWIRRTRIASPDWEEVVLRLLERFRMGYGESRSIEAARAQLFRSDESAELAGVILLVLLAEWDAYVVTPQVVGLPSSITMTTSL
jgi:hypothetical protein